MKKILLINMFVLFCLSLLATTITPQKLANNLKNNSPELDTLKTIEILKSIDKKESKDTKIKIAYDNNYLYFIFDCNAPSLKLLNPKVKGHDNGACADDSIELFLDPKGDGKQYFHYMLSWDGAYDDRLFVFKGGARVMNKAFNEPWIHTVENSKKGWKAIVGIPLIQILSYGDLNKIKFNVVRNYRDVDFDGMNVVMREKVIFYSLADIVKGAHEPENFVELSSIEPNQMGVPEIAILSELKVLPYNVDKNITYSIAGNITGYYKDSAFKVEVADKVGDKKAEKYEYTVNSKVGQLTPFKIDIPAKSMGDRKITVRLLSGDTELQNVEISDYSALAILDLYMDRSYYTTEKDAYAICRQISVPAKVKVTDSKGKILVQTQIAPPKGKIAIPLEKLPLGKNDVNISLLNNNKVFFTANAIITKLAPKKGCEWKIDKEKRVMLRNGKPFLPIQMIFGVFGKDDVETHIKHIKDMNFNSILIWGDMNLEELNKTAKFCEKDDLNFAVWVAFAMKEVRPRGFDAILEREKIDKNKFRKTFREVFFRHALIQLKNVTTLEERSKLYYDILRQNENEVASVAKVYKNYPHFMNWFLLDEPFRNDVANESDYGRKLKALVDENDGYHPSQVNYSATIHNGDEYVNYFDILTTDPYWIPGGNNRSTPNFVSQIVAETVRRGEKYRQQISIILQVETWGQTHKRVISVQEQYLQTYLALIHGAKGLSYFIYPASDNMKKGFTKLNSDVQKMAPAILNGSPDCKINYYTNGKEVVFAPKKDIFPDVQGAIFKALDGTYLLLLANSRPFAINVELSGLTGLKNFFTNEKMKNTVSLEKYGVCAIKVEKINNKIGINSTYKKSDFRAYETGYPYSGRATKKNMVPNPSFEECTVGNFPDYYPTNFRYYADVVPEGKFGKNAIRLKYNYFWKYPAYRQVAQLVFFCSPQFSEPTPCVFSFYAKANKPGAKLEVVVFGKVHRPTVGTNWERIQIKGIMPAKAPLLYNFIIRGSRDHEILLDGLQLEKGTVPTKFED